MKELETLREKILVDIANIYRAYLYTAIEKFGKELHDIVERGIDEALERIMKELEEE